MRVGLDSFKEIEVGARVKLTRIHPLGYRDPIGTIKEMRVRDGFTYAGAVPTVELDEPIGEQTHVVVMNPKQITTNLAKSKGNVGGPRRSLKKRKGSR